MSLSRSLVTLVTALLGCGTITTVEPPPPIPPPPPPPSGNPVVLFVGNSLTYTNSLPNTVASIARAAGKPIETVMAAGAGLALIDHINGSSNALPLLSKGGYDIVVLQQGPTPAGICRDSLILWTRMFDQRIKAAGARTAVMMAWSGAPGSGQDWDFDDVRLSFQLAASAVNGIFLPAGEAWRAAWREDPTLKLYGLDGYHPSPLGTYLAALEIYERISGTDVRTLAPVAFTGNAPLDIPEAEIRLLQRAAHEANSTFGPSPGLTVPPMGTGAGVGHC
ncbi:MAG: hypothetical protein ABIZ70_00540 [Gemmatimonadales bacterium]